MGKVFFRDRQGHRMAEKYICVSGIPPYFMVNEKEVQKEIDTKGFTALASYNDFGAVEVLRNMT